MAAQQVDCLFLCEKHICCASSPSLLNCQKTYIELYVLLKGGVVNLPCDPHKPRSRCKASFSYFSLAHNAGSLLHQRFGWQLNLVAATNNIAILSNLQGHLCCFSCRPPDVQTVRSSGSASTQAAAAAVAEIAPAVVTRIPLPAQDWGAPLLEAAVEWDPPAVVAGVQFELRLRLQNRTHHLVELGIRLGDTSGFVLAGAPLINLLHSCLKSDIVVGCL